MLRKHPRGLVFIFFTEMWERVGFYTLTAILVLYMDKKLGFGDARKGDIYGLFLALCYFMPLLGGWLGDRVLGRRTTVRIGAVLMASGYVGLAVSSAGRTAPFFLGLLLIGLGTGIFKVNMAVMVGNLYADRPGLKDAAFNIFYMGVNLGAFAAPIICGLVGDTGDPADFKWGFLVAALVSVLCLIIYVLRKDSYLIDPHGNPIGIEPAARKKTEKADATPVVKLTVKEMILWIAAAGAIFALFVRIFRGDLIGAFIYTAALIIPAFVISDKSLTKIERQRIWVIYIIAFFVIFFWSAFEQAGISLTYFAVEQTNRDIMGWTMPASWFQSFNAVFVILLAPLFAQLWLALGAKNREPSSPVKQAIGLLLLALGYLIIAIGVQGVEPGVKVSILWLAGLYFIHTMGELCLSPIGLSMVNKLSPVRFASLLMGVWYLSMATANKLAGALSTLYPEEGRVKSLMGIEIASLFDFFMVFVVMAAVASLILFLLARKLQLLMHGVR